MAILRLNYAVELRYGVLVDLAKKVLAGEPIDVSIGSANVIWQSEANAISLQSLLVAACPPRVLNIAGAEFFRIREVSERLANCSTGRCDFQGRKPLRHFSAMRKPAITCGTGRVSRWTR